MGDVETRIYSIVSAQDALNESTGKLMDSMLYLNNSRIWTTMSRIVSGILPGFWSVQNKFRAITDVFRGYNDYSVESNKAVLKQMKSFAKLSNQLKVIPDDFYKMGQAVTDAMNEEDWVAFDLMGEAMWADMDKFMKMAKEHVSEFDTIKEMVEGAGFGDIQLRKEILGAIEPQREDAEAKKKKMSDEYKKKVQREEKMASILEGLDPSKDGVKIWFLRQRMKIGLLLVGAGAFFKGAMMWFAGIAIVLALIIGWFKKSAPMLKGAWEFIKASLTLVVEGVIQIVKGFIWMIQGALTGDIELVLKGLFEGILLGAFKILIGLVGTLIGVAGAIVIGLLGPIMEKLGLIENSVTDIKSWFGVLGSILIVLGAIVAILGAPAFIGTFLYSAAFTIGRAIALLIVGAFLKLIGSAHTGGMRSGLTLVGEKGPELVTLPKGSRVHSNAESRRMAGGNTIHVHINGRLGASDIEIRDIADKVGREINLRMNRTSNTQMRF